jgi:hypothetical protein
MRKSPFFVHFVSPQEQFPANRTNPTALFVDPKGISLDFLPGNR